jgi:hypothetical protein
MAAGRCLARKPPHPNGYARNFLEKVKKSTRLTHLMKIFGGDNGSLFTQDKGGRQDQQGRLILFESNFRYHGFLFLPAR